MSDLPIDAHGRPRPSRSGTSMLALGLAGLALAGCTTPARQVDVKLPSAFEAPAGSPLASQALDQWWIAFNDPVLNDLITTALAQAPDARLAAARLEEARAVREGQVRQIYIPQTPLTGSAKRTDTHIIDQSGAGGFTQGGVSKTYSANFDVSWELDLIGRRGAARRVVDNDLAAARFSYEGARAALAANVAQSYFEARGYAVQLEDARQNARIAESLFKVSDEKGRRGLVATSEGDRTAADLAQAQAQAAALEAQLQASRRSLLILVGKGVDPLASLPVEPILAKAPPVPAAAPAELLARRPDIREAAARLASASGNLNISELALFPTLTLTPGVGISKSINPSFLQAGSAVSTTSSAWTLGANLSIPVLNIPKLMSDIKVSGAQVEQAAVTYEQTVQKAFGETESALVQQEADERRVTLLAAGERRAAVAYEASRKGYAMGLIDLTTTLQAEQSWRAARTASTGAQTQALQRAVQTYKALGGGWSPASIPSQAAAFGKPSAQ